MFINAYPKTVTLKDSRKIVLRPLASDDFDRLHAFFLGLPTEDRLFLRDDVTDPQLVKKWTGRIDLDRVIPLVALDGDKIVADGTLHIDAHGWMRHVGHIRLVTGRAYRRQGLGALIVRELVAIATEKQLEKLQAYIIEDDLGSLKMLEAAGFERHAVLKDMVRDMSGNNHHLVAMISDVSNLSHVMDDWIQDTMIPEFRSPGEG